MKRIVFIVICLGGLFCGLPQSFAAVDDQYVFDALGAPAKRKVEVAWNRFHDTQGLEQILRQINQAFPTLTSLYSIGKSHQGRDIWCLEVTNRQKGNPERKPGMYVDGNIHGNEVQAGEVVAYIGWYLCETYEANEFTTRLVDQFVFYLIPTINPDGRDHWFHSANTPHSSRTGMVPLDNDRDGRVDEDGYDDLNGDGSITQMIVRDPNGRYRKHPEYPTMLLQRVKDDERGEYDILGWEGIDNDGDGRINEDDAGGYDSNRNWPFDWQPGYVQHGAHEYPFSLPNTYAVSRFVLSRTNIASAQSFHNSGGMILQSPGREGGEIQRNDERVMRSIGRKGENILPFYRSMIIWSDLYTVWGGELDWFYGGRGILAFTNELYTPRNMYRDNRTGDEDEAFFIKHVLLNEGAVEWREYEHPTYGLIEIGGARKEFGRVPPSFLLEEECHRNMAFVLYHASMMPRLSFGDLKIERLDETLYTLWIEIRNDGMIPTRTDQDIRHNISYPDIVSIEGGDVEVVSSGVVRDRYFKHVDPTPVRPNRLELEAVPGLGSQWVQFIVAGRGECEVVVDSVKGGRIERPLSLN